MGLGVDPDGEPWSEWPIEEPSSPGPNEVGVWSARLDWGDDEVRRVESWLPGDERQRAERFHFGRDRRRFVARRVLLRVVLGKCLGLSASKVALVYGANGKPELEPDTNPRRLCFNASHSQELAVFALAVNRELGVDVERVRPLDDFEDLARRFFSVGESVALKNVVPGDRAASFFNCWTRKEAFLKALGLGLARPLNSFDVSLVPGEPACLLNSADPSDCHRWSMHTIAPDRGFVGAVVATGDRWTMRCARVDGPSAGLPQSV